MMIMTSWIELFVEENYGVWNLRNQLSELRFLWVHRERIVRERNESIGMGFQKMTFAFEHGRGSGVRKWIEMRYQKVLVRGERGNKILDYGSRDRLFVWLTWVLSRFILRAWVDCQFTLNLVIIDDLTSKERSLFECSRLNFLSLLKWRNVRNEIPQNLSVWHLLESFLSNAVTFSKSLTKMMLK
jgi:hypothetical protein